MNLTIFYIGSSNYHHKADTILCRAYTDATKKNYEAQMKEKSQENKQQQWNMFNKITEWIECACVLIKK